MYAWLWRRLPGSLPYKLLGCLLLLVGVLALLFYLVFPWAAANAPWENVNVDQPALIVPSPGAPPSVP